MESAGRSLVVGPGHDDLLVRGIDLDVHLLAMLPLELSLGAFDADPPVSDGDFDAIEQRDRFISNAGHRRVQGSGFRPIATHHSLS